MPIMCAHEAGNSGDLIKHEWLTRVLDWLPPNGSYLDAFAGPTTHPLSVRSKTRLSAAPMELKLLTEQRPAIRGCSYYGSSVLARNKLAECHTIHVYDENNEYGADYENENIEVETRLEHGLDALGLGDYSLVLIDPDFFFQPHPDKGVLDESNEDRLRRFWREVADYPHALLISLDNEAPQSPHAGRYNLDLDLVQRHRLIVRCIVPPIAETGINGEDCCFRELIYLPEAELNDDLLARWRLSSLRRGAAAVAETLGLEFRVVPRPTYGKDAVEFIVD